MNECVSRFVQGAGGKWFLEVDGRPYLYQAVQTWYPPEGDFETYFSKTAGLGYRTLSLWVYWRDLEPVRDRRDWTLFDELIRLAVRYDLRLDIVWGGTNFCDHLDPRFAPDWVLSEHRWHHKDDEGHCKVGNGFDMGPTCIAEPDCEELFQAEKSFLLHLLDHLREADPTHRVICLQLENEININRYAAPKSATLAYIDRLAAALGAHPYRIAVRLNISTWQFDAMDPAIDALPHIDAQGIDTYCPNVSYTRRILTDGNATKFRYVAENGAYDNSTAHIVAALACGAFYNIYKLDYDAVWDRPGIYGVGWRLLPVAVRLRDLNESLACAPEIVATAVPGDMAEFNTEGDGMPSMQYEAWKQAGPMEIGFATRNSTAVGLVVYRQQEGRLYVFADADAFIRLRRRPREATAGRFGEETWEIAHAVEFSESDQGIWMGLYHVGECLRLDFGGETNHANGETI